MDFIRHIFSFIFKRFPEPVRRIILLAVQSFAAAFTAVVFMTCINRLFRWFYTDALSLSSEGFLMRSFLIIGITSFVVSLMLKKVPEAAGSGIPEAKAAYWKELGFIPFRPFFVKFFAGIISIAGGASLGREGPTIFLGSAAASQIAGFSGTPKRQRRAALLVGASAGLAAAFNTPLAAITFIIEEMVNDLNTKYLGQVVLASLIGALVVHAFVGNQPSFLLPKIEATSWMHFLIVPFTAFLSALFGLLFQRVALKWRRKLKSQERVPRWIQPLIGGMLTWLIGSVVFLFTHKTGVFGLGYNDLSDVLNNRMIWWIAGILAVGKLAATIISYSFGGCGGIFSPTLCIGGMCGAFVCGLAKIWIPLCPADCIVIASVGMCACLGTVIRAPLTSMLIVFEMTHQFEVVPSLMLGIIISQIVIHLAKNEKYNFYEALLIQDGHEILKINPPKDLNSWRNLPVSSIMNPNPFVIRSLEKTELQAILKYKPYQCFPYKKDCLAIGVLTRDEITRAINENRNPVISDAVSCYPNQKLSEVSDKFLISASNFIVVINENTSEIEGVLTLHDILRAQASIME